MVYLPANVVYLPENVVYLPDRVVYLPANVVLVFTYHIYYLRIMANRENRLGNDIIRGKQEFDLIQKRLFLQVVNELNPKLEISEDMFSGNKKITIYNAKQLLNTTTTQIAESIDKLSLKRIKLIDHKNEVYDFVSPFPRVTYSNNTIEIVIFEEVIPKLMELKKGFTRYQLESAMSLSSIHSQRLYEILCSWKDLKDKRIQLDVLLNSMNLDDSIHKEWRDFHVLLKRCKKEIDTKTDITFTFEAVKERGSTVAVMFHIKEDKLNSPAAKVDKENIANPKTIRIHEILDEIGIRNEQYRIAILSDPKQFWDWNTYRLKFKDKVMSPSGHCLRWFKLVSAAQKNEQKTNTSLTSKLQITDP